MKVSTSVISNVQVPETLEESLPTDKRKKMSEAEELNETFGINENDEEIEEIISDESNRSTRLKFKLPPKPQTRDKKKTNKIRKSSIENHLVANTPLKDSDNDVLSTPVGSFEENRNEIVSIKKRKQPIIEIAQESNQKQVDADKTKSIETATPKRRKSPIIEITQEESSRKEEVEPEIEQSYDFEPPESESIIRALTPKQDYTELTNSSTHKTSAGDAYDFINEGVKSYSNNLINQLKSIEFEVLKKKNELQAELNNEMKQIEEKQKRKLSEISKYVEDEFKKLK
ncbi:unnamed protein product [Candida verbasci]|uniref:Uncharacterized protein n=1 Tax=Candida verbasci TaxID=1227364 RepID=A0A9W4U187_9ASCO|nr:unnamed protein product [Candida verbasci]